MKSFLDFAKDRENEELKRQIDHHDEMAEKHQEKAEAALMMGDRDGHALHMAKHNHFKTQCENLKSMKEEVDQFEEGAMPPSVIKVKEKIRMASDDENKKRFAGKSKSELSQMAKRHGYGDKNPYAKFHDGITEEVEQIDEATPAWQRKEGKSEAGGLNKKGIMSYRRANPGSKLSMAVTTKPSKLKPGSKAANRRKSFCARMSGMKKRLTSAKTAKDPNSRINKSLRKWNC